MSALTEKQFDLAVGKIDEKKHKDFLKKHPVERTSEWVYEWQRYLYSDRNIIANRHYSENDSHERGLDGPSGIYDQLMYQEDHKE